MARSNLLVFAGVALSVATGALWALTEKQTQLVCWDGAGCNYAVRADAGRVCFERVRIAARLIARQGGWSYRPRRGAGDELVVHPQDRALGNGYGFEWAHGDVDMAGLPASFTRLALPIWPWALLCLTPAAARVLRLAARRRRRRFAGRCRRCRYDLRATPKRCPECGLVSSGEPEPAA